MPAGRTSGLPSGAEAASNPECCEEGGGDGGGGGGLSRSARGADRPGQTEFYTVSQMQHQCVNQTS